MREFGANLQNYKVYGYQGLSTMDRFMHRTGLNYYFVGAQAINTISTAFKTAADSVDAFYNSENGFQTLGAGLGATVGSGMSTLAAGAFAWDAWRRVGGIEAIMKDGVTYKQLRHGGYQGLSGQVFPKGGMGAQHLKGASSGVLKGGRFIRSPRGFTIAALMGAAFAEPLMQAAGGAIGGVMDTMMSEHKARGKFFYDTRYFAGQAKYDNGYYDSLGQLNTGTNQRVFESMKNYQNKMMSVARIYHSR